MAASNRSHLPTRNLPAARDTSVHRDNQGEGHRHDRPAVMSPFVKVFGCRPDEDGSIRWWAGVRKPPREETAGGDARGLVRRYGDLIAADDALSEGEKIARTWRWQAVAERKVCWRGLVKVLG